MSDIIAEDFDFYALTDLIDRLVAVLDRETAMVEAGEAMQINELHDEKTRLGSAVRQGIGILQRDQNLFYDEDPVIQEDIADLMDAIKTLVDASGANERALRAAMRATDRVIRALVTGTVQHDPFRDPRYTRTGRLTKPKKPAMTRSRNLNTSL